MASIFSRIIEGKIPSFKIAENERFFAFLDIRPVSTGHTLVVPKVEIDYVFDLDDRELSQILVFAKPIARALDVALKPLRTGLVVEGLEVPHAHLHLIPIYREGQHAALGSGQEAPKEELESTAQKIRHHLERL